LQLLPSSQCFFDIQILHTVRIFVISGAKIGANRAQ
jgi:hypothetical protein